MQQWIWVQILLWDPDFTSFKYIYRSWIAGSYDSSTFNFWYAFVLFSIRTVPISITTTIHKGSLLCIFSSFVILWHYSLQVWGDILLWCISWIIRGAELLFMFLVHLYTFGEIFIQVPCPFLNKNICFACYGVIYTYIYYTNPLSDILFAIFSPIFSYAFSFWWLFPLRYRNFLVWCNHIIYFCFCYLCFWCQTKKHHYQV